MKEIEKRDSVLTPKQQIERLLRPGSSYFNLNPFEVLHVDCDATIDEIKKKYRRLSILVHPDKNMVGVFNISNYIIGNLFNLKLNVVIITWNLHTNIF